MPLRLRFAGVTARKASRSSRVGEGVFGARMLIRISNFRALAARSVIGKGWKSAAIVEFWPEVSGSSSMPPARKPQRKSKA